MKVYGILKFALSITFCLFRLFLLTAGIPSKGSSFTLKCSVPGRCISGLLRGWLFPFLLQDSSDWRFSRYPFCFRRPCAKNFILIFVRTKSCLILFSGAGEKPGVAGPNPRLTWFPKEWLMPLLKMMFSEIPVVLWPGK